MEYLAVVVANKNQITSLSPLVGSNWPGIISTLFSYLLSIFHIHISFLAALKKLDLTSNQLKEVQSFSFSVGNA